MNLGARRPAPDRVRTARVADVEAMARLINGYAARGLMLPKTPAQLYRVVREYVVVPEADGSVAACGGLRIYGPHRAEIVGLAVREDRQGRGHGARIVDRLVADARAMEVGEVFAMTLQEGFFRGRGFEPVARDRLPEKVAADCRGCPRRAACAEVAMLRRLSTAGPGRRLRTGGRRLRVISP